MNEHLALLLSPLFDRRPGEGLSCFLHGPHQADLEKSGIVDATIDLQKLRDVPPSMIDDLLGYRASRRITSALLFPFFDPSTNTWMDHVRMKIFPAQTTKRRGTIKYLQPRGSGVRLYFCRAVLELVYFSPARAPGRRLLWDRRMARRRFHRVAQGLRPYSPEAHRRARPGRRRPDESERAPWSQAVRPDLEPSWGSRRSDAPPAPGVRRMKARSTRPPKLRLTREQRAFAAMQARLRARLESLKFSPHERAHVERLLAAASLPPASPEVELVRLFEIPDGPTRQQWRQHLLEERQAPRATETSP
jgi:hypothetical protein